MQQGRAYTANIDRKEVGAAARPSAGFWLHRCGPRSCTISTMVLNEACVVIVVFSWLRCTMCMLMCFCHVKILVQSLSLAYIGF